VAENPAPNLTARNLEVLRELLRNPTAERTAGEIGSPINLPAQTVAALLARLIGLGLVFDRRSGTRRLYRLAVDRIEEARAVAGERKKTKAPAPTPQRAAPRLDEDGNEVWTLTELEVAVARGQESPAFLALVRPNVDATRRR
jgi:DNA-binding transcriptional ArsR family regulator